MTTDTHPSASVLEIDRDNDQPLAEQVAAAIEQIIEQGAITPGGQIPSVREAQSRFDVSPGTIVKAYRLLQHRGWIESRPQSGFYVKQRTSLSNKSPHASRPKLKIYELPCRIAELIHEHSTRPDMVGLGAAVPDPSLLPRDLLTRYMGQVMRDQDAHAFCYGTPEGREELRLEIARCMLDVGCVVNPEEIIITAGATEAMNLGLKAVTNPGDVVAVESPTYYGLLDSICSNGLKALPVSSCSEHGISIDALEKALSSRKVAAVALVPSHSNPLGGSLSAEDRKRVATLATQHDVTIIEDDVYGGLSFNGSRERAIQSFDDGGNVIYCSSFSKTLAPGFRVGWCVPGRYYEAIIRQKRKVNVSTAVPQQLAIAKYLAAGHYNKQLRRLRNAYALQVNTMIEHVAASFPEATRISRPDGGSVIWIELDPRCDAIRLFEDTDAEGIGIAPGPLFAADGSYRNCIRLNCARPWSAKISDAVCRVGQLAKAQLVAPSGKKQKARRIRKGRRIG